MNGTGYVAVAYDGVNATGYDAVLAAGYVVEGLLIAKKNITIYNVVVINCNRIRV